MELGAIALEALRGAAVAFEVPAAMPPAYERLLGIYGEPIEALLMRLEWRDGALVLRDPEEPDWMLTLLPTGDPLRFTVDWFKRESGEPVEFHRRRRRPGDGRDDRPVLVAAVRADRRAGRLVGRMSNEPPYRRAYADASWTPFWLDRADRPAARPALEGDRTVDLVIVGGGFTGLWAAVQALEDIPGREVVVLEGERVAFGASGRNGGFCEASLTHGLENGLARGSPTRSSGSSRRGGRTSTGIAEAIERHGIDCAWEPTGTLVVATEPHQVQWCATRCRTSPRSATTWRSSIGTRCAPRSTRRRYLGGFWRKDGSAHASTRRGSPGGWPPRPSGSAPRSTSTRR